MSNYAGWQLVQSVMVSRLHGWEEIISVQPEYNLLSRQIEWEVVPASRSYGLGLLAWSPLGGGWLASKHSPAGPAAHTRVADTSQPWQPDSWERRNRPQTWTIIDAVAKIAANREVSNAQVALNWLRAQPCVTAAVLGVRTPANPRDNLGCIDWQLDADELHRLDDISRPHWPYPYQFIEYNAHERTRYRTAEQR